MKHALRPVRADVVVVLVAVTVQVTLLAADVADQWVSDLGQLGASLWACAACWTAARRSPLRRPLLRLAAGAGCWAAAVVAWSVLQLGFGEALPSSLLVNVLFLAAGALGVAALLALPGRGRGRRLQLLLDGMLASASLMLVTAAFLWPAQGYRLGAAFPMADLMSVAMIAVIVARSTARRGVLLLLAAAFAVRAATNVVFSYLQLTDSYATGHVVDAGWAAAFALLALAARRATATGRTTADHARWLPSLSRQLVAYVPVAAALITAIAVGVRDGRLDGFVLADGFVIVGLLIARQATSVAEHARLLQRLSHDAHHDALTGLPNRSRLNEVLDAAEADGRAMALLLLDLDGFKDINDTLGHPAGDAVLRQLAGRLRDAVGPADLVTRFGGDEFVIVPGGPDPGTRAQPLAAALLAALADPVEVEGRCVEVRAAIGVAHGTDASRLLTEADVAMYRAKVRRLNVCVFEDRLRRETVERIAIERDLREALHHEEFVLHFQPVVALETGAVTHVEALVRWQHPVRGMVAPGEFIPVLESLGLMAGVGRWILRAACEQAAEWRRSGLDVGITVNVSAQQLGDLAHDVAEALAASGLAPGRLTLELTESLLVADSPGTRATLEALRAQGVRIAVDDFGTGYSSLAYLRHLPVDVLKIDKAFVDGLGDRVTPRIVAAILELAAALDLDVIAEGIEHGEQAGRLLGMGCVLGQGFHWSRPLPAAGLSEWFGAAGVARGDGGPRTPAQDLLTR